MPERESKNIFLLPKPWTVTRRPGHFVLSDKVTLHFQSKCKYSRTIAKELDLRIGRDDCKSPSICFMSFEGRGNFCQGLIAYRTCTGIQPFGARISHDDQWAMEIHLATA